MAAARDVSCGAGSRIRTVDEDIDRAVVNAGSRVEYAPPTTRWPFSYLWLAHFSRESNAGQSDNTGRLVSPTP